MSSYTSVLLICDDESHVRELNEILEVLYISMFRRVGNSSFYEMNANYLPYDKLMEAVESIQWEAYKSIQLFTRGEHDDRYVEVAIHPNHMSPLRQIFEATG